MKVVYKCICCDSKNMRRELGWFEPFLAQRYFEYPAQLISISGSGKHFPLLLTGVFKCNVCGVNFTQLRPDADEMTRYYQDYAKESYHSGRAAIESTYPKNNGDQELILEAVKNKEQKIREFLSKHMDIAQIKTLLDYGGGSGLSIPTFFNLSKAYLYDIGVEDVKGKNIETINNIDGIEPVDFIQILEVLEHVSKPAEILLNIKVVVKKDTHILITVPHDCFDAKPEMFFPAYHEHINRFSEKSISTLLRSYGYKVIGQESIEHRDNRYDDPVIRGIYCLVKPGWLD